MTNEPGRRHDLDGALLPTDEEVSGVADRAPYRTELSKIAEQVGEADDPFAAWETIALLQQKAETDLKLVSRFAKSAWSLLQQLSPHNLPGSLDAQWIALFEGPGQREIMDTARQWAALTKAEAASASPTSDEPRDMASAPKDRPILAWCDHEADPYGDPVNPKRLTLYAAHAEGLSHASTGWHIIEWGGSFEDGPDDGGAWLPDWWFVRGSEFEQAANPVLWTELPPAPASPTSGDAS